MVAEILKLLKKGENTTLEFKESFAEEKEILETVCAFSNSAGGKIVVGVDDRGKVKGVALGKNTLQNFLNKVKSSMEPAILPQVEQINIGGKKLVILQVSEGIDKPYFLKGVAFKRVGKSNQRIPRDELEKMILKKYKEIISFEDRPVQTSLDVIDESLIVEFVREASLVRRVDLRFGNKEEFLRKFGGLRDGKPTTCALLCFSKSPQLQLPYAMVKCGVFTGGALRRETEVGGDLRAQISGTLDFLRENLTLSFKIDREGRRVETYEIPLEALREAIVNALAHRDYSIPSPVYVKVFEDRVEVTNPGELPEPLTPEDLKRDHPSILRNQKIANFLFLSGFIERWGRGTNKMIEICLSHGLREPEFVEEKGFFKLVLFRGVLKEMERRVLEMAREKELTSVEVARELGVNERTARKYLSALCSAGLLSKKRIGRKISYFSLQPGQ
ncbi:MAG: putative DNA binding domain-containing protein [Candidatus Hadarchaeales archaeon]